MSLFQAREWWSYASEHLDTDNFSLGINIALGAFPKELGSQADVILMGSLSG